MEIRFKKKGTILDVLVTAVAAVVSVGTMLYGVWHFGLQEAWPELVLNPLAYYPIRLACSTLSVALLLLLTFFYARKEWKTYSKRNLWMICILDMLIAALYHLDITLEPANEYTAYLLTEIWIRPTITYGLVACCVSETKEP